jgi:hypothetical protein
MYTQKAILLRDVRGHERGTPVDVGVDVDGSAGRWLVLRPPSLAGAWVLPMIDADHAITVIEAAHAISTRRGHEVVPQTVRRYLAKGTISCASKLDDGRGGGEGTWMISRNEVWTFEFPEIGNPHWNRAYREKIAAQEAQSQEADDEILAG